jgi:hypothetical protein
MASRTPNSAAPQLISISLPLASDHVRRRGSHHSSTESACTTNRHGWLLCTEGARAADAIRKWVWPASTCANPGSRPAECWDMALSSWLMPPR